MASSMVYLPALALIALGPPFPEKDEVSRTAPASEVQPNEQASELIELSDPSLRLGEMQLHAAPVLRDRSDLPLIPIPSYRMRVFVCDEGSVLDEKVMDVDVEIWPIERE